MYKYIAILLFTALMSCNYDNLVSENEYILSDKTEPSLIASLGIMDSPIFHWGGPGTGDCHTPARNCMATVIVYGATHNFEIDKLNKHIDANRVNTYFQDTTNYKVLFPTIKGIALKELQDSVVTLRYVGANEKMTFWRFVFVNDTCKMPDYSTDYK